jgi:endogenous inhibitor of DNA gyrase (YacG/DUF329 family)
MAFFIGFGAGCENCGKDSWEYELNDTKAVMVLDGDGKKRKTQLCPKCGKPLLKGETVRLIS